MQGTIIPTELGFTFEELATVSYALHKLAQAENAALADSLMQNAHPNRVQQLLDKANLAESLRARFDDLVEDARANLPSPY